MNIQITYKGQSYQSDLAKPIDISIPMGQVKCFYATAFQIRPYVAGDWIGAVKAGSPVNFFDIQMSPHGNGTHTECVGHITPEQESINDELKQFHFFAQVVSVAWTLNEEGDKVITKAALLAACPSEIPEAIVIRTLPNATSKQTMDYSGTNPPFLSQEAMKFLVDQKVKHLLLDLPSVDKEDDGGTIWNHRYFWNKQQQSITESRKGTTITELIFVPNEVADGLYLLNIQIPSIPLDAAPSKPVLYQLKKQD